MKKRSGKWLIILGVLLLPLAAIAKFALVGYTMTALCFLFGAACLIFFGLMRRWGTKAARVLTVLAAVALLIGFGLFLYAEIPIVAGARSDEDADADYIIVMGAAVHGTTPSLSMVERTNAALSWLEAHPDGVAVVSGGQGKREDVTEAQAMAELLASRGIDPARILLEPEATSSYENLAFSLRVIEADGGDPAGRIAVASSEYHLCRVRHIAERLGFEPVCVAAKTAHVTLRLNYFLREAAAMWKCHLLGIE